MTGAEGSAAAALGEELLAPDAEVRRLAAARLPALGPEAAAPLLLLALGDADWRVRKDATLAGQELLALAADRGDETGEALLLSALVEALAPGDNVGLRNAVIEVLAAHGRAAIAAIARAFPGLDADGRKLAVEALGRTGEAAALGPLTAAREDADDNVRHAAMEAIAALGRSSRDEVLPVLAAALGDPDRFVQLIALNGLNALEAPAPWPQIEPLLADPMLRPAALAAAALAESPEAPAALVRALPAARGRAFGQIVGALSRLLDGPLGAHAAEALRAGGPEVAARLARAAADPTGATPSVADPSSWRSPGSGPLGLRGQALVLAALARAPGAIEAAIDALAEPTLAEPAQRALLSLGGPALGEVLARLRPRGARTASEPEQLAALIDVAAALGAADPGRAGEICAAVRAALQSPSTLVATTAAYALAKVGQEEDLGLAAERAVKAPLPVARAVEGALAALAERYPEAARARAREMMQDPARWLPAVVVLESLAAPPPSRERGRAPVALDGDEIAFLQHAAATGDVRARCAAVGAAVTASGAASLDLLSAALADEEREVQLAGARALGRLRGALASAALQAGSDAASRAAELLDLLRRSGDAELLAAADPDTATPSSDQGADPGAGLLEEGWGAS